MNGLTMFHPFAKEEIASNFRTVASPNWGTPIINGSIIFQTLLLVTIKPDPASKFRTPHASCIIKIGQLKGKK